MSGIAGLVALNGTPLEHNLLQQLTEAVAYRGPHHQRTWISEPIPGHMHVGFGHALLQPTPGLPPETQPFSFDHRLWITADARIDGQTELKQKLALHGCTHLETATDAELILQAYHVWGPDCLQHLIGDFAFAIWDAPRQHLFCGRDHFGIKPFYYAHVVQTFIFASAIAAIRHHPAVSAELNDQAIGDFLLLGCNFDEKTTVFQDIQRIPPAHYLLVDSHGPRLHRYWDVPDLAGSQPLRYKKLADYLDHFHEVFRLAVADRVRTTSVGVKMSGGTDSTAVAAVAHHHLRQTCPSAAVVAHTITSSKLFPDDREAHFARIVADELGFNIRYFSADDLPLYNHWQPPASQWQQPFDTAFPDVDFSLYQQMTGYTHVALTGFGGDLIMRVSPSYYLAMLKKHRYPKLIREISRHLRLHRTLKGLRFRSAIKQALGRPLTTWAPAYPYWLQPDFVQRLRLQERWDMLLNPPPARHSNREVYEELTYPRWTNYFEFDANMPLPLEVRHPFLDTRLISYLLAIPAFLCYKKTVLRMAMTGILPETIRLRPKTPLAGNHFFEMLRRQIGTSSLDTGLSLTGKRYIDSVKYQRALLQYIESKGDGSPNITAPLSLEYWLQYFYG